MGRSTNRTWRWTLDKTRMLIVAPNRATNDHRTVLLDGCEIGTLTRAYFTPSLTLWIIDGPHGSEVEQFGTLKAAAVTLARRAMAEPVVMQAPDEIPAFS